MNGTTKIIGFKEDMGKDKDGRLIISVKQFPNSDVIEFLEWLGDEFIKQGGLYAIDIINPKGTYRIFRDNTKTNIWLQPIKT